MGVGLNFWQRVVLFLFICLFVCFSTPKVGDYFVFKSHKWVRFSCLFVCLFVFFFFFSFLCFVLFFLQNVQFPHHISGVRLIFFFLSRRLVKFFAFFYFCFCFASKNSTPLISNGAPLSLFYYTDDGGHYVIDNFEFPCNSVKNLIPIWNFTNTFIQEVKYNMRISNPLRRDLTPHTFMEIMEILKGIGLLTDVESRALSKF